MLMREITGRLSYDLSEQWCREARELADFAAKATWRTERGTVHAVNPMHRLTLWFGPHFWCGVSLNIMADEAVDDLVSCRNCLRAMESAPVTVT